MILVTTSMVLDLRVPVLTVDIRPDSRCIELSGPAVASWSVEERRIAWMPDRITVLDELFQGTVKKFTDQLGNAEVREWSLAGLALKNLIDGGRAYWGSILGGRRDLILPRLAQSLVQFVPAGVTALDRARTAPLIEIKANSSSLLPLDLLPLGAAIKH
jgi:hypothetical protein